MFFSQGLSFDNLVCLSVRLLFHLTWVSLLVKFKESKGWLLPISFVCLIFIGGLSACILLHVSVSISRSINCVESSEVYISGDIFRHTHHCGHIYMPWHSLIMVPEKQFVYTITWEVFIIGEWNSLQNILQGLKFLVYKCQWHCSNNWVPVKMTLRNDIYYRSFLWKCFIM